MKIAVDVDGCVADFMGGVCYQHNAEFGTRLTEADITEWDFLPLTVFERFGHQKWPVFWRWVQYHDIFASLAIYPGAKPALQGLLARGAHTVHFVTHRPDWAETTTCRWLRSQGFILPVVFTATKYLLDYDIFLDDSPEVLLTLAEDGKRAVRMVRPWNREVPGIPDADSWRMAVALLEGMLT
jgi:5'(3')-deoxyribonucleotidase